MASVTPALGQFRRIVVKVGSSLLVDRAAGAVKAAWLAALADDLATLHKRCADVLVFSHGHFLRALAARWLGLPLMAGAHFILAPGAISILGYEHGNRAEPALIRWNDRPSND